MIDFYRALRGPKYCPWCNDLPYGLWENLLDKYPLKSLRGRIITKISNFSTVTIPLWKIGES